MKTKFINFLKQDHAWEEFKREIENQDDGLDAIETIEGAVYVDDIDSILRDSFYFFYKNAVTNIDWQKLSNEWEIICGNS